MRFRSRWFAGFGLLIATSFASRGLAQEAITPPRLLEAAPAVRPDGGDEPVRVGLFLTIDETGSVVDATVVESAGDALDAAALEAARALRFEPARQGEAAIATKIRYEHVFAPAPGEAPGASSDPAAPEAEAPPAAPRGAEGPRPATAPPDVDDLKEEATYSAVAEVRAPAREPTRRTLAGPLLTRVPGTNGDAVRAIELMPGVARSPQGTDPILRGASGFESQVFFDGAPVPLLYHFGGVKSFVNARLLDRVDLYPGNFSVRYGRRTGGVIDVRSRGLARDGLHGVLDLSLLDSSVLVEAPITDDAGVAVAARRSNIDLVFESVAGSEDFAVVAAPLYWDYQTIGELRLGRDTTLRAMAYGSRDSLAFFFDEPAADDPSARGDLDLSIEFHRVQVNLTSRVDDHDRFDAMVGVGTQSGSFVIGPESRSEYDTLDIDGRAEWTHAASRAFTFRAGFDVQSQYLDGSYVGGPPLSSEGEPYEEREGSERKVALTDAFWLVSPAAYVEIDYRPHERVVLVPGLRADYFGQIEAFSLDPRLAARVVVADGTTLKSGVGWFTQPPLYYEALPVIGNPDLEPYHALHASLGVEQTLGRHVTLETEGFYKWITNRVVATPSGEEPHFENGGTGRVYGLEVGASAQPWPSTQGILAYTLSRSERRDHSGPWRLFDNDQTHVLSFALSHDFGAGWQAGARFRYVTGNPRTAVVGSVYDATTDLYRPIYGRINGARDGAFHQLDLRVEKAFRIGQFGKLALYLELMNAYNAENPEGLRYGYDYSRSEVVTGMPIFPNLGIRGEL